MPCCLRPPAPRGAARARGFRTRKVRTDARRLSRSTLPCLVTLAQAGNSEQSRSTAAGGLGLRLRVDQGGFEVMEPRAASNAGLSLDAFRRRFSGDAIHFQPAPAEVDTPERPRFGFCWVVPRLLPPRALWPDSGP